MRCIWEQSLRGSDAGGCRSDPLRHSVTEVSYILCTKRVSWPPASTSETNWTNTCVGQQCNLYTTRKYNNGATITRHTYYILSIYRKNGGGLKGCRGDISSWTGGHEPTELDSTFATIRQVWNRCILNGSIHFGCSFVLKKVTKTK